MLLKILDFTTTGHNATAQTALPDPVEPYVYMYPCMFLNKTLQTCNAAAFKCKSVVVLCKRFLPRTQS